MIEVDRRAYWRVVSLENKINWPKEYRNLIAKVEENVKVMIEGRGYKAEALKVRVKTQRGRCYGVRKAEKWFESFHAWR